MVEIDLGDDGKPDQRAESWECEIGQDDPEDQGGECQQEGFGQELTEQLYPVSANDLTQADFPARVWSIGRW